MKDSSGGFIDGTTLHASRSDGYFSRYLCDGAATGRLRDSDMPGYKLEVGPYGEVTLNRDYLERNNWHLTDCGWDDKCNR